MASAFYDQRLTLAPFKRVYGDLRAAAMLADSFFAARQHEPEVEPAEAADARVMTINRLPNRAKFEAAVERWQSDISFDSFPADMKDHDSFAEIVEHGYDVVPLIAAQLRREPSFLFLALEEIFGEDPVPEESYGNVRTVSTAWLEWLQR